MSASINFQRSNEAHWIELEQAVQLPARELDAKRFFMLYRRCCEHLALARARGFPAPLVERLARVTARARRILYRRTDPSAPPLTGPGEPGEKATATTLRPTSDSDRKSVV